MALETSDRSEVEEALCELLGQGYTLSVETRVHVHDHKVGAHAITCADKLLVTGPERVPEHIREIIVAAKPLLLAAACVLDPPTPVLRKLVRRYKSEHPITPTALAATIAAFVGLDPVADASRVKAMIRAVLEAPDYPRKEEEEPNG